MSAAGDNKIALAIIFVLITAILGYGGYRAYKYLESQADVDLGDVVDVVDDVVDVVDTDDDESESEEDESEESNYDGDPFPPYDGDIIPDTSNCGQFYAVSEGLGACKDGGSAGVRWLWFDMGDEQVNDLKKACQAKVDHYYVELISERFPDLILAKKVQNVNDAVRSAGMDAIGDKFFSGGITLKVTPKDAAGVKITDTQTIEMNNKVSCSSSSIVTSSVRTWNENANIRQVKIKNANGSSGIYKVRAREADSFGGKMVTLQGHTLKHNTSKTFNVPSNGQIWLDTKDDGITRSRQRNFDQLPECPDGKKLYYDRVRFTSNQRPELNSSKCVT